MWSTLNVICGFFLNKTAADDEKGFWGISYSQKSRRNNNNCLIQNTCSYILTNLQNWTYNSLQFLDKMNTTVKHHLYSSSHKLWLQGELFINKDTLCAFPWTKPFYDTKTLLPSCMICKLIHFDIAVHHITFVYGFSVIVNLFASSPGKQKCHSCVSKWDFDLIFVRWLSERLSVGGKPTLLSNAIMY